MGGGWRGCDFGRGPVGQIVAGLVSAEKRPVAAIGLRVLPPYERISRHTTEREHVHRGGRRLHSHRQRRTGEPVQPQLGLSYEKTFAVELDDLPLAGSGASGIFLHPGVVFSTNPRVRFFGLVSPPMTQQWRSLEDRQRFRLGAGAIVILGH